MTIFNSYKVDPKGSITTIPNLLKSGLKIYLYTGDWDDVVPFTATVQEINAQKRFKKPAKLKKLQP